MKKRILSTIITLSLLLAALPMTASAASTMKDVPQDAWYADAVDYCVENGLMNGKGGGIFDPEGTVTRAQVSQVLYNMESKLSAYCHSHPESRMGQDWREFGFRVDTDKYTYMLRLNPNRGEYNLYVYCYVREQLDRHMARAGQGIRFVDPHYKDLFRLADGDRVRITDPGGQREDWTCRFIDEEHMECGFTVYQSRDFAEQMEQAGNTVIPLRSSLPEKCFAALETTGEVVIVHRGVMGYTSTGQRPEGMGGQEGADVLNAQLGVTRARAAAMLAGSMFGWACPGADPVNYDAQGRPVRRKEGYGNG